MQTIIVNKISSLNSYCEEKQTMSDALERVQKTSRSSYLFLRLKDFFPNECYGSFE